MNNREVFLKVVSRQFKRRMYRLRIKNLKKYGSIRKCLFDGYPCERRPSPIDGDRECFGSSSFGSDIDVVIVPPCGRYPRVNSI